MSSKEDQIIDGTVVKETTSEDHSLRVSMENLRLRDDGHHTRGSQSMRFEDGHFQMIDPLEIGNVGTVQEKLKEAHAVISAEQESQGYQGDQQIQGKRLRKLTEKGREYRLSTLENKRAKLVSRLHRKSSEIDDLMYSYQNSITVKEELAQLNSMFKMLVDIHEEFEQIEKEYTDDIWFDDIDQKVFSFTHKVHNWLKEEKKEHKRDHSSRSSTRSSYSKSKSSTREKAVEEKLRVAELIAESSFMKKQRDAEY